MLGNLIRLITGNAKLPSHLLITVSPQMLCLAEKDASGCFNLSYFIQGRYGNYLIGIPVGAERFDRVFKARGGIKYMFSMSFSAGDEYEALEAKAAEWIFGRYGAYLVAEQKPGEHWNLPIRSLGEAGINDLKIASNRLNGDDFCGLDITGSLLSGFFISPSVANGGKLAIPEAIFQEIQEDLTPGDNGQVARILYPNSLIGDPKSLKPIFQGRAIYYADPSLKKQRIIKSVHRQKTDNFQPLCSWKDIEAKLVEDRFIFHFDKQSNSLALYDDVEFERNDFEVVSPTARKQIVELLLSFHYVREPGQVYIHPQHATDTPSFVIPPSPRSMMSGILDILAALEDGHVKILTPTQQMALIARSTRNDRSNRMVELAAKLPFNQRKIIDFCKQEGLNADDVLSPEIKTAQKAIIEKMRRWRPKGARRRV